MNKSQAFADDRPSGFPSPSNTMLIESKNLINSGKFDDAISRLNDFKPESKLDNHWKHYILGVAYLENKETDKGVESLVKCYEMVKSAVNAESEAFRIAGSCLKKIGWFYRNKKDYLKGFAYHNIRYSYVIDHGSNLEVHDALISLDVDAYFLEDLHLSEKMLKESIIYGDKVKNDKDRFMALGTTYNNLGGTSYGLKKFEQAEFAIITALDYWTKYESIAGESEFKVVWAHYGIGDVYEQWTKHLKENDQDFAEKKWKALEAYQQCLNLATERKMSEADQNHIKERIQAIKLL
ncbi:MAG: tetratricopeptide repeat protein [Bdellovibrionaceae bacterium]|nr:tetratricopeptide repeat protein [Pseudobdellovibrionaceae bacterium]